jgi:hypothetical protein
MDKEQINHDRRFAQSYRRTVELGGNNVCSLQRHFRGALHEVVHWLDLWAANHPERFVIATVPGIVEHCKKYGSGTYYKTRLIEYCLAHLRRRCIISGRLVRMFNGEPREGFIVARHDCVTTARGKTKCVFVGMATPFDCWHQLPSGEIFWVDPTDPQRHSRHEELNSEKIQEFLKEDHA